MAIIHMDMILAIGLLSVLAGCGVKLTHPTTIYLFTFLFFLGFNVVISVFFGILFYCLTVSIFWTFLKLHAIAWFFI